LLRKLRAKGYDDTAAQAAIRDLDEGGLQSDGRFTQAFVRRRTAKGYGVNRIRQELRLRGIDEKSLEGGLREYDWDELISSAYVKKYGVSSPESPREYAARFRFLIQRGFSRSQIQALFRRLRLADE